MPERTLNDYAKLCHEANKRWWYTEEGERLERDEGEMLQLQVTEIAEATEGLRKGLMDDKLPHRKMEEVELADALIRIFDFCGGLGLWLTDETFAAATEYPPGNMPENRAAAHLWIEVPIALSQGASRNGVRLGQHEAICRIAWYAKQWNLDLEGAIAEKLAYNATRYDHTYEARKEANGKKF